MWVVVKIHRNVGMAGEGVSLTDIPIQVHGPYDDRRNARTARIWHDKDPWVAVAVPVLDPRFQHLIPGQQEITEEAP